MSVTKKTYFTIPTEDKPGTLSDILTNLREENVDLEGLWGWGMPDGKAQILIVPKDPTKFKASKSNKGAVEGTCFRVMESDKVGSLLSVVERASKAGINLQAVDALSLEGKVGAYIWCAAGDVAKLEAVL
jgi:hypothetical protein